MTAVAIQERIVSSPSTWLELAVVDMAKALAPNTYFSDRTIIAIGFKDSGDDSVTRVEVEDAEGKHNELRIEFNRKTLEKIQANGLTMPKRVIPFLSNSYRYDSDGNFIGDGKRWSSIRDHIAAWLAWARCEEQHIQTIWVGHEFVHYHWEWLRERNRLSESMWDGDAKEIMSNAYKNPPVSSEFSDLFA